MEQRVFSQAHVFGRLTGINALCLIFFLIIFSILISSCASSNVSREVAANSDQGVQRAKNLFSRSDNNIADTYQNTNQATKGAILGGIAGGMAGAATSGVGTIPGTITGSILGASYGSYIDANTSWHDQLENRGAIILILGDQIMIILPSARIFANHTARIKTTAYSTLYLLRNYLNTYTNMLIKVAVYTNVWADQQASIALSQQQANNVARFLEAANVNTRVLYAVGRGASNFIEKPSKFDDDSENNRIEVTLERLP